MRLIYGKRAEHSRALELRKAGESYSRIRSVIGVSKSTLSLWLKDHPLPKERIRELRDWNEQRIERYRETRRAKRDVLLKGIYESERELIAPLLEKDLFIAGLFLYWGEGGKTKTNETVLSNTNPAVVKAFIVWLRKTFGVEMEKIRVRLHLYSDMDIEKEIEIWSQLLRIPPSQFLKPYIKTSRFVSLTYKSGFGHGTCNVILRDGMVTKRILMGLKVIEGYFLGQ